MKKFRDLISEARPQDYVNRKTSDEADAETTSYKPRSAGEVAFKDKHEVEKKDHPVAGDNQFKSTKDEDESEHKGHKPGKGEEQPVKQGTSDLSRFMNRKSGNKTPARRGDKTQGDAKPVIAKEEVEVITEDVFSSLKGIAKKNKTESVKFKNGKSIQVDPKTASAIVKLHDSLNSANARKLKTNLEKGEMSFMKMVDFAMM